MSAAAFVLDASIAAAAVLPDEASAGATAVVRRAAKELCVAPVLWRYEIANTLEMARRRGRLGEDHLAATLAMLFDLHIQIEDTDAVALRTRILPLARKHGLTIYDATYLELAKRLSLPLATLDTALIKAARSESAQVLPA